jgi:2-iminobutanoate/2-iminopropanoate deaminase
MDKIHSSSAAPAAGPYSQAIKAGGTIYVSGQIPADASGALIQESITASTKQCCTNISKILEEAGSEIGKVVRCGVSLSPYVIYG